MLGAIVSNTLLLLSVIDVNSGLGIQPGMFTISIICSWSFYLSLFAPEKSVSRYRFGTPVPR